MSRLQPGGRSSRYRAQGTSRLETVNASDATTTDGVRLLSHRPSVLYKVEHLATEPPEGDIAVEGLKLAGPGWDDRLKTLLRRALAVRARLPVRRPARRRAGAAAAGRDAAGPRAHRLVPRVPLARPDEAALPADRRDRHGPLVRPRGAHARQARRGRGARRRAAGRRRGPRRAVLLRLPRPRRRARDRAAADARGRDPVRQPRPARLARRRVVDAHDVARGQPAQRRPVADLPRDRAPRAHGRQGDARGARRRRTASAAR